MNIKRLSACAGEVIAHVPKRRYKSQLTAKTEKCINLWKKLEATLIAAREGERVTVELSYRGKLEFRVGLKK